jgi:hypothetical protein
MKRAFHFITSAALFSLLVVGCGGDAVKTMLNSPEMQTKIMDAIASNPTMTATMMSRLMGSDDTRQMVVQSVMGNADARGAMMQVITRDPEMVETFLSTAVQDSAMKAKILDMVRGMRMAMTTRKGS